MDFEKQMYEVQEKWEESYFSDDDRRRIEYIRTLIPKSVSTILDVGCGNGILVNYLHEEYASDFKRVCGTDRSKTSLKFVKTEKYKADITQLPFKDKEFDIITCLEVIEHLPYKVFDKALEELVRVTSDYLIISVPYNEKLDVSKIRCIKCATEFNPFYHMHSFVEEDLRHLFSNEKMEVISVNKVEPTNKARLPYLKKWLSRKIHPNNFPPNCICPMCGYNEFEKLKAQIIKSPKNDKAHSNSAGLSKYWPHFKEAKWIAAVYKRK